MPVEGGDPLAPERGGESDLSRRSERVSVFSAAVVAAPLPILLSCVLPPPCCSVCATGLPKRLPRRACGAHRVFLRPSRFSFCGGGGDVSAGISTTLAAPDAASATPRTARVLQSFAALRATLAAAAAIAGEDDS